MRRAVAYVAGLWAAAWLAGCGPSQPAPSATPAEPAAATAPMPAEPASAEVEAVPAEAIVALEDLSPPIAPPHGRPAQGDLPAPVAEKLAKAGERAAEGDYAEAADLLAQALQAAPDSAWLHRQLGLACEKARRPDHAETHLRKAVETAGDDLEAWLALGRLAEARGEADEALLAYRTAARCTTPRGQEGARAEVLLRLARALADRGRVQATLDCYNRLAELIAAHGMAVAERPDLRAYVLQPAVLYAQRGELLLRLRRPGEAAKLLERAFQRDRSSAPAGRLLVLAQVRSGQYKAAEQTLAALLRQPTQRPQVVLLTARALAAGAEASLPLRLWDEHKGRELLTVPQGLDLAVVAERYGAAADARRIREALAQREGANPRVALAQAGAEGRAGAVEAALGRLGAALAGEPALHLRVDEVVAGLAEAELDEEFERRFADSIRDAPPDRRAPLRYVAGRLAEARGKVLLAERQYERAIEEQANFAPAYVALLEAALAGEKPRTVQSLLQRAARQFAAGPVEPYLRGLAALRSGKRQEALGSLAQARQRQQDHLPTLLALGEAHRALGNLEAAERILAAAQAAHPRYVPAGRLRFEVVRQRHEALRQAAHREAARRREHLARCRARVQALRRSEAKESEIRREEAICERLRRDVAQQAARARRMLAALAEQAERVAATLLAQNPAEGTGAALWAELALAAGRREEAREHLRNLQALRPGDPRGRLLELRIQTDLSAGMPHRAEYERVTAALDALLAEAPQHEQTLRFLAMVHHAAGQYAAEAVALGRLYERRKDSLALVLAYARALVRAEDFQTARDVLEGAGGLEDVAVTDLLKAAQARAEGRRGGPADAARFLLLLHVLERQGATDELVRRLVARAEAEATPRISVSALLWHLRALLDRPVSRLALLAAVLEREQDAATRRAVRRARAWELADAERYDEALRVVEALLAEVEGAEQRRSLQRQKVAVLAAAQRFREAQAFVETLLKKTEEAAVRRELTLLRARLCLDAGDPGAARRLAAPLAKDAAPDEPARELLFAARRRAGELEPLLGELEAAIQQHPQSVRLWERKGVVLAELGRPGDAAQATARALAIDSEAEPAPDPVAGEMQRRSRSGLQNNLGYFYAVAGVHLDKAEALLQEALHAKPGTLAFRDSLAWVYYRQGRFREAGAMLRDALADMTAAPDDAVIYDHAGDTYYRLGWTQKAAAAWRQAAALGRRDEHPSREVRELLEAAPKKIGAVEAGRGAPVAPTAAEMHALNED